MNTKNWLMAALLFAPGSAYAQSAEETVLYLVTGFDGNETTIQNGGYSSIAQPDIGRYSAKLTKKDSSGNVIGVQGVSITKIDDCRYDTVYRVDDGKIRFVVDFSRAYEIKVRPGNGENVVYIKGATQMCNDNQSCSNTEGPEFAWATVGDPSRLSQAFQYFRVNFCRGGGF